MPCRWINRPFTRLRVLAVGAVAVTVASSEAEDRCPPGGEVVGREVDSGRLRRHRHIGLFLRSGGDAVICFEMPARTEGSTIQNR